MTESSSVQVLEPQKKLRRRDEYHWPRRLFHMASGAGVVGLSMLFPDKREFLLLVAALVLIEFVGELVRISKPNIGEKINSVFAALMREGEAKRISGIPYYGLGILIAYVVFPKSIAILAVLYLAFGDPVASLMGCYMRQSKRKASNWFESFTSKSPEGSLACFVVCSLITLIVFPFVFPGEWSFWLKIALALIGGFSATIAELIPVRTDDNLSIPIISGVLLWLFASLFGVVPGLVI